ncbi:hypothetical protein ON010_g8267 [Phytophthora cinnamomi]|nr:hypothetical protein ON010_g8267 [Phytophthora cinnamomi]
MKFHAVGSSCFRIFAHAAPHVVGENDADNQARNAMESLVSVTSRHKNRYRSGFAGFILAKVHDPGAWVSNGGYNFAFIFFERFLEHELKCLNRIIFSVRCNAVHGNKACAHLHQSTRSYFIRIRSEASPTGLVDIHAAANALTFPENLPDYQNAIVAGKAPRDDTLQDRHGRPAAQRLLQAKLDRDGMVGVDHVMENLAVMFSMWQRRELPRTAARVLEAERLQQLVHVLNESDFSVRVMPTVRTDGANR